MSKRDKMWRFSHSVFACETARKCSRTLKYFDPGRMFNQQRFLNVWALAAVQFDTVADLEGVRGVRLNPPLQANYFNFMGKFKENQVNSWKRTPLSGFEPPFQKS